MDAGTPAQDEVQTGPHWFAVFLPIVSLLVLLTGWSVFWYVAAHQTANAMDSWLKQEEGLGRRWICPERTITGYPLRVEVSCANPTFEGAVAGLSLAGSLRGLRALAQVYQPNHIVSELVGPLHLRARDTSDAIELNWAKARVIMRGVPQAPERAYLEIEHPNFDFSTAGTARVALAAGRFELHMRTLPQRPSTSEIILNLGDFSLPQLNALAGNEDLARLDLTATIAPSPLSGSGTLVERAERWRNSGGLIDIGSIALAKGATSLQGKGTLGLDEFHRVQGQIDASLTGMDSILKRFGIPSLQAVDLGGLVAGLLGARTAQRNKEPAERPIRLLIRFESGHLFLGPIKTPATLQPLY